MVEQYRLVYMTAGSRDDAVAIADVLVEERLAACVNVIGAMTSVYRWEGAVRHDEEVVLIAKTTTARLDALTQRVRELHSYECPCIVALPVDGGDPAFLEWISDQIII